MHFPEWFQTRWREAGEAETRAIYRLCVATGCGDPTIRKALKGDPMSAKVARRIASASNGELDPARLAFPESEAKGAA